jgi:hypothetical protein
MLSSPRQTPAFHFAFKRGGKSGRPARLNAPAVSSVPSQGPGTS